MIKPLKPRLVYEHGYWKVMNLAECMESTTLNTKERWCVLLAFYWSERKNK